MPSKESRLFWNRSFTKLLPDSEFRLLRKWGLREPLGGILMPFKSKADAKVWWTKRNRTPGYQEKQQTWRDRGAVFIRKQKKGPCEDCGGTFPPECMQFDHVRGEKHYTVASMVANSEAKILEEIAKCALVCANCHAIRTEAQRQANPSFNAKNTKIKRWRH